MDEEAKEFLEKLFVTLERKIFALPTREEMHDALDSLEARLNTRIDRVSNGLREWEQRAASALSPWNPGSTKWNTG